MAYDNDRVNLILTDGDHSVARLTAIVADILQTGISVPAPAGGATEAKQDAAIVQETAIAASASILDDWDESDRAKVNPIVGQAGVAAGAGASSVATQRVVAASDSPEVATLGGVADAAVTNPASSASVVALLKGWLSKAAVYFPAALGQTTKSGSLAVTIASDDDLQGKLGALTETAPLTDTASSGANGRLQRLAQRVTSLIALFPTAIGRTTSAGSLSTVIASDDAMIGIVTETAPASDTASSGLNGRLQRIAQRITSLIALVPTALGQGTMATSFKVVIASDQTAIPVNPISGQTGVAGGAGASSATTQRAVTASDSPEIALIGAVLETAPASDTASSGLNGRLQRIAQRITSLIALFPTALGQSTMANGLRVVLPSDQSAIPVNIISGQTGVAGNTGVVGATVQRVVSADDAGPTTTVRLLSSAATTNATSVKGSAGVLYGVKGACAAATAKYLKLYNKATSPTVGTDVPVMTIAIPATGVGGGFFEYQWPAGRYFSTGIAFALTGAAADADTTALASGDVVALNMDYR